MPAPVIASPAAWLAVSMRTGEMMISGHAEYLRDEVAYCHFVQATAWWEAQEGLGGGLGGELGDVTSGHAHGGALEPQGTRDHGGENGLRKKLKTPAE